MPRAIQIPLVDPTDTAELPATADPGTVLLYADGNNGGMVMKRDDAGVDTSLEVSQVSYDHNGTKTTADSPYAATANETIEVDPTSGVTINLPDPATVTGRVIRVVNVTTVSNPGAAPFDTDAITVQATVGSILGTPPAQSEDVLATSGESREYESNGTAWVIQ